MRILFDELTGNKRFIPYLYQEEVAQYLLSGKNIFLCAPTGAGKTWAALLPFLLARRNSTLFVDHLIYILPLRTLATTIFAETVACCKNVFDVKTLPEERTNSENELIITIQTGEQKNDPFFEGDIVFTTIDQCLSSYLNCPVSLPRRLGNINAGALLGSLVVFDEFHLLEPGKSMDTAIEMLERLKPFSQFAIMTATLSTKSLNTLKEILGGEIVQLKREEVLSLPSHREKKRTYRWINRPLSSDDVLNHHAGKRSIVILNTVTRAQNIFKELRDQLKGTNTKLMLLHSRFYSEDRKNTENDLTEWFGKETKKTNVILVTTQVVEAGIDISADNLHTELAPFNSIVQRAGRCARYEGERGIGTVWVYELETTEKGLPKLGPYRDAEQMALVADTKTVLEQLPEGGDILDFVAELERLDKVHSSHEAEHLESYKQNQYSLKNKVHEAMDGRNETAVRELIRDVASVNVIISNKPKSLQFNKDRWPRMLSVPRTNLYNLVPFFEENRDFGEAVAWYPMECSNTIDDESDISFGWERITAKESLKNVSWLIVINPQFASYSPKLGLQIGVNGDYEEPKYFDRPALPRYKIHYEPYRDHIQRVVEECRAMSRFYRNAAIKLSCKYGVSTDQVETLAVMSCVLHDVGKLSVKWQESVRKWQQFKNPQKLTAEPIAHSDYNPETDFEQKMQLQKQPPHAAEGAYAMGDWLSDYMGEDVAAAVWTAIARHHGAFTESLGDFKLIDDASKWVKDSVLFTFREKILLADKPDISMRKQFANDLLGFSKNTDDERLWPLYMFLVRRLRLADQKSQKGGEV
ncbi:MAG: CRISPR-associated helicase Cas3' [Candidatus Brocadiaceae bacterium]